MVHVIECRTIAEAREKAVRLIWEEGEDHLDQRGELTKEIQNLVIWLKGNNHAAAALGKHAQMGIEFRKGLVNDKDAFEQGSKFEYAYGNELRELDMLEKTIRLLKENPSTRRAYMPIFKPAHVYATQEVPCFVGVDFLVRDDVLFMTMFARSNENLYAMMNDIFGFTGLQEYVAQRINCEIGDYTQHAVSAHLRVNSDMDGIQYFLNKPNPYTAIVG